MTPPGTPKEWTAIDTEWIPIDAEWRAINAEWTAIDAEWRTLDKAFEAQGMSNATREEKINPGTQPKPEERTTPPARNTHGVGGGEDGHLRRENSGHVRRHKGGERQPNYPTQP